MDSIGSSVMVDKSVKCPRCGEIVAPANLRCRSCGLARQDFESYDPASDSESSNESGGFELGPAVTQSSGGFALPPVSPDEQSAAGERPTSQAGADSAHGEIANASSPPDPRQSGFNMDAAGGGTAGEFPGDSQKPDSRVGVSSDPNIAFAGSSSSMSASASRMTLTVSCEHCGTVNQLPKSLAKTGVLCTRCGRPLITSTGSSTSTSGSIVDSRIASVVGADRRKHLKRSVEKALSAGAPAASKEKFPKSLGRGDWKEIRAKVEDALESESPPVISSAIEAIDQIVGSRDKRGVEFLIKHAESMPDAIRGRGKQALGELQTPGCVEILLKSLIDDIPELYPFIVRGLGAAKDRRATRTLVTIGTYWEEYADAAIESIRELDSDCLAELIALAERKDKGTLRPFVLRALGEVGSAQSIPVLANSLKGDRRPEVRVIAADALGLIEDRAVLGPLVAALNDKDESVRVAASAALQSHPRKRIVPALVHILNDENATVRVNAARLLGRCGVAKAMAPLGLLIADPVPEVRAETLHSLAQLGDETALPQLGFMLAEARNANDSELTIRVAESLGDLKDPRATLPLLNAMPGAPPNVQVKIVGALGELQDGSVLPALVETMTNGVSPAVRAAAVTAIGRLGMPECVEPLTRAVKAGPPLKTPAVAALGGVPGEDSVLALTELLADELPNIRRLAATSLGDVGNEAVVRKLKPLLDDDDERVREAASESLTKLGFDSAEPAAKAEKPKKARKTKVKKRRTPKMSMPSFDWDRLRELQPGDLIMVAKEYPVIPAVAATVLVACVAGYMLWGQLGAMVSGKDTSIVVRGLVSDISIAGDGESVAILRDFGVLDVMTPRGGYLLDLQLETKPTQVVANHDASIILEVSKGGESSIRTRETQEAASIGKVGVLCTNVARTKGVYLTDGKLSLIDMETGEISVIGEIEEVPGIRSMATNNEANQVLMGTKDGTVLVWNGKGSDVVQFYGPKSGVMSLAYSPDSEKLAVGGATGELQVFEKGNPTPVVDTQTQESIPENRRSSVSFARFLDDSTIAVLSGRNVKVYDVSSGTLNREFAVEIPVDYASLSADGELFASSGEESKVVSVYAVETGEKAWEVPVE